jgi:hypothetical protein
MDDAAARPPDLPDDLVCSARGCRSTARWAVRWNNPRLHTAQRRKVWLACPDHRSSLEEYLRARGFWRDTIDAGELGPAAGSQQ